MLLIGNPRHVGDTLGFTGREIAVRKCRIVSRINCVFFGGEKDVYRTSFDSGLLCSGGGIDAYLVGDRGIQKMMLRLLILIRRDLR